MLSIYSFLLINCIIFLFLILFLIILLLLLLVCTKILPVATGRSGIEAGDVLLPGKIKSQTYIYILYIYSHGQKYRHP